MQETLNRLLVILDREINLQGLALGFSAETKLRGSLPQLDSMAVVSVIAAIEERFGIEFPEDALDGAVFDTVGTLVKTIDHLTGN